MIAGGGTSRSAAGLIDLARPELALNGGAPVRTARWLDNFTTGEAEKRAAMEVLDTGYLSLFEGSHAAETPFSFWGGPYVQKLEREWSAYYGSRFAIAVNSATSGLYAAVGALGVGFGDEVIVSPYTMSACAAAALVYGAIPVFADVQLETGCLDPDSIEERISDRTRAIIVVHQFGIPADMDRIMALASAHGLRVIEDCAQAHGARYKGRPVGTFGDIGVFSLNVNKTIQTGEGGVCTTSDEDLRYRLALIRNHGEAVVGPAGYEAITNIVGFNYRMTEMQAAMASEQLAKLESLTTERLRMVAYVNEHLSAYPCLQPLGGDRIDASPREPANATRATFYVLPFRYFADIGGVPRERLVEAVNREGLAFHQGYVRPLYMQPLYQRRQAFKHGYPFTAPQNQGCRMDYEPGICPNAERLHDKELLLNEYIRPPQTLADMKDIVAVFEKVISGKAGR